MKNNIKEWLIFLKDELWYLIKFDNLIYLIVGVITAVTAMLIDLLVVKDWWAFAYAFLGGIITFFALKFSGDPYRIKGVIGWSLFAFAILLLSTSLIVAPTNLMIISNHTFGCIIGIVLLLFILWVVDSLIFWRICSLEKYTIFIGIGGALLSALLSLLESTF